MCMVPSIGPCPYYVLDESFLRQKQEMGPEKQKMEYLVLKYFDKCFLIQKQKTCV